VSLFRGNHLHVAALIDVRSGQKQKIENARKALSTGHLLTADKYAEMEEADIEDILGREFYVALVNRAFQLHSTLELPTAKPSDAPDRVVVEVEARFATMPKYVQEFDHFVPAEFLFQNGDEGTKLPGFNVAIERMEKLINDLNDLIR
jgi:hypothetical protein